MPSAHLTPSPCLRAALLGGILATTLLATAGCGDGTASAVVLTRSGGLAGFDDELRVTPDGAVTGSTRTGGVSCTVPAAVATVLATAPAPSVAPAAGTDRLTVVVDRGADAVQLGEAQGSDPLSTAARELLDDVQRPPGQRTVCR